MPRPSAPPVRHRTRKRESRKRESVEIQFAGAGDDLIQIGAQSGQVRKFGAARSVIDKIDGARPFFLEHGEVFPVIFRKIVGIGQRHDVQRVGKAAQAVLFARGDGCAVGETGENERMFALFVLPKCGCVLRP